MDDEDVWLAVIILAVGVVLLTDRFGWGLVTFGGVMLTVWLVQKEQRRMKQQSRVLHGREE